MRTSSSDPIAAAPRPRWQRIGWLLGAIALWVLASAGTRALLLPDEGRYAGVAYAMLHGDVLVPRLHGLPFFHKPPLMYWIDAAALRLFGVDEIAARIAPLAGALVMAAAMAWHSRRQGGVRQVAFTLGALATMPFFYFGAQYANHDMLVAGLVTAAVVAGVRAAEDAAPLRWAVLAWTAAALAVLAKGLIGVVLPALVLLPWLLWHRRWRAIARLLHPFGLTAFAVVAAPWFVAMQWRYPGFADYFFLEQHVRRYAQGGFNNAQPWWFYVAALPLLTLPWSLALLISRRLWRSAESRNGAAMRGMGAGGEDGRERSRDGAAMRGMAVGPQEPAADRAVSVVDRAPPATGGVAFHAWWVTAVLLFFSLPQSKLVGYVLPALGPFAALLALALSAGAGARAWRWGMVLAALGCAVLAVVLTLAPLPSHRDVARALGARLHGGDRVVLVDGPYFDVPFYARMTGPPVLLADWNAPGFAARDDWRKELRDAARFEPALGARVLWPLERSAELPCGVARVFWIARPDWQPPASIGSATRVLQGRYAVLWQSPGRSSGCP